MVECLSRDREAAGSSLTSVSPFCPWARHINSSLVLVQPRKTCPYITERLLMGRKESNKQNKYININPLYTNVFFLLGWYNKLGIVCCAYLGVWPRCQVRMLKKYCILFYEDFFTCSNSVDPDEMLQKCGVSSGSSLKKYRFRGFQNTNG